MPSNPGSNGQPEGSTPEIEGAPTPSVSPAAVPAGARSGAKTTRERAEEKRQAKLDLVQQQLESGSLVIRTMTQEERRQYPPRSDQPKKPGRR